MQPKRAKPKHVNALLVGLCIEILLVASKGGAFVDYLWVIGGSAACLCCVVLVMYQQRWNLAVPTWNWSSIWALSNIAAAFFGFILVYNRASDEAHIHAREIPYPLFIVASAWLGIGRSSAAANKESSVA
jgi:hypothetical protein